MMVRLVLGVLFLSLIFGCSENPVITLNEVKHGYSMYTFFDDQSGTTLYIAIDFGGIQYDLPRISINDQYIDTGYASDHFTYQIKNFHEAGFKYSIEYNNDIVSDSVIVPGRVDSVYCNGILLRDSVSVYVDSSSNYLFSWNSVKGASIYTRQIWSTFSEEMYSMSMDTTLLLVPGKTPYYGSLYGQMYLGAVAYPEITYSSRPNKESEKLFVYYDGIRGPSRTVYFSVQ